MCRELSVRSVIGLLFSALVASMASADVELPSMFSDHAVLQRDIGLPVWGWADPGEKVTVVLGDQTQTTTAEKDGKWSIELDALKAGGPHVLKVKGNNEIEVADVLAAKGDKLKGFAIAGADKQFVWADALIDAAAVVVSSSEVKDPAAVRYGWSSNPDCNLYNKADLPASPFRTDDWSQ